MAKGGQKMFYSWFFNRSITIHENKTAVAEAIMREINELEQGEQANILDQILQKWPKYDIKVNGHQGLPLEEFTDYADDKWYIYERQLKSLFSSKMMASVRAEDLVKYLKRFDLIRQRIFLLNLVLHIIELSIEDYVNCIYHFNKDQMIEIEHKYQDQVVKIIGILMIKKDFQWAAAAVLHQLRTIKDFEERAVILYSVMYLKIPDFSNIFDHIDFSQHYLTVAEVIEDNKLAEIKNDLADKIMIIDNILSYYDFQEIIYFIGPLLKILEEQTITEQMVLLQHILENSVAKD